MKPTILPILASLLSILSGLPAYAQHSRTISGTFPQLVEINVVPPEGTRAWTVEEVLSGGAIPVDVSGGGIFDEENGKAKWGPFLDDGPRVLSYHLTGPAGEVTIDGIVSFDGNEETVDTMDIVVLPDPETNFSGWRYLTLSEDLLHTLAAHPLSDLNLDGFNLLQEYAFGFFLPEMVDRAVILEVPGSPIAPPDGNLRYYRNRLAMDLDFSVQRHDPGNGWVSVDFENMGVSPKAFDISGSDRLSEVVYLAIPLAEIEGSFLRVQARLRAP